MSTYGYLHTARVVSQDEASGGWYVQSVALARDRKWGPIPSCVTGLAPGDKVVLAATGTTRDNLLILGALDPRYPDIGDIPGLAAALAAKADQTALDAFEDATNLNLLVVNDKNAEQDDRLDDLMAADTGLDRRLDTAETTIAGHTTTLGSHTSTLGTHTSQLTALNTYSQVFQAAHEFDIYGDLFSPFPRNQTTNFRTLVSQTVYIWRTRTRVAASVGRVRVIVQAVGTGPGLCTGALYTSSSAAGPYTLAGSATNALTSAATQNFTFASAVPVAAGTYIILLLYCGSGYTAAPKIAAQQLPATVNAGGLNTTIIWGTKVGQVAIPAAITITDGTWTADGSPWWLSAAN